MKLVVAIIRPERLHNVLESLFHANVAGLTISRVQGHGGEIERVETYRGTTVKMELTDKVRIEIGVSDHFVEPTVIADVDPHATIAQEEIFGPVLAVIKAKNFDDALRIANDTEFGLTGSVFTDNPDKIRRAQEEFFVGNLYFNRKSTGALVGVHPFGGFNMSGTDSKAGGRDYLGLFLQAKAISRKVGPQPPRGGD